MKPGVFLALAAACCFAHAADVAASAVTASAVTASAVTPSNVASASVAASPPVAAATLPASAPAPAIAAVHPAPASFAMPAPPPSSAGLLQTVLALSFVLALLFGLAWCMKRYGPKAPAGNARLRLLSSLSLGGRERILLIEVADQWIVVGAAPGRVNALATMPRQEDDTPAGMSQQNGLAAANFSEWLKQTIDKRNGK